jgi:(S)-2-hydroxyglutarate dehydrogenase
MNRKFDYVIIGAGIIGMAIAKVLRIKFPTKSIFLIEKEIREARHASGRNSGVLHSGFYYPPGSLKAKLTVSGHRLMKAYCHEKDLPINQSGKLVVAQNARDLPILQNLLKRGEANGCNVSLISEAEAEKIEPNIKTYQKALYSPETSTINPERLCQKLRDEIIDMGIAISFYTKYLRRVDVDRIETTQGEFITPKLINCAGLYADQIAHDYGMGKDFTILPFKGLYLNYTKNMTDIVTNIYPVPNPNNPFLGVHFTKTYSGKIKIGPTAIPAFWREHYEGVQNMNSAEFKEIISLESKLFFKNSFGFRSLALAEMKKYFRSAFINQAQKIVKYIDPEGFTEFSKPGIRAQLVNLNTLRLVDDFVIEEDKESLHILNAVSPAFTCAFSFADYIVDHYLS